MPGTPSVRTMFIVISVLGIAILAFTVFIIMFHIVSPESNNNVETPVVLTVTPSP